MIKIFLLILLPSFMSCASHEYILFEHVGAIDKPMNCIVVTKESKWEKEFCELQEEYVAEEKEFKKLEKYVLQNSTKSHNVNNGCPFGSFKIQLDNKSSYIVEGRQSAITYFTNLIVELNSSGNYILANIIERSILIRLRGR